MATNYSGQIHVDHVGSRVLSVCGCVSALRTESMLQDDTVSCHLPFLSLRSWSVFASPISQAETEQADMKDMNVKHAKTVRRTALKR